MKGQRERSCGGRGRPPTTHTPRLRVGQLRPLFLESVVRTQHGELRLPAGRSELQPPAMQGRGLRVGAALALSWGLAWQSPVLPRGHRGLPGSGLGRCGAAEAQSGTRSAPPFFKQTRNHLWVRLCPELCCRTEGNREEQWPGVEGGGVLIGQEV